jgi:hypothetical protein
VKEIVVALSRTTLKRISYICANVAIVGLCGINLIETDFAAKGIIVFAGSLLLFNWVIWSTYSSKPKQTDSQEMSPNAPSRTVLKLVSYTCADICLVGCCAIYHFVLDQSLARTEILFALSLILVNWQIWKMYRPKQSK